MRMARIKLNGEGAVDHCISRIVGGQRLLEWYSNLSPFCHHSSHYLLESRERVTRGLWQATRRDDGRWRAGRLRSGKPSRPTKPPSGCA